MMEVVSGDNWTTGAISRAKLQPIITTNKPTPSVPRPNFFVTRMLTRDLFAIANRLVFYLRFFFIFTAA